MAAHMVRQWAFLTLVIAGPAAAQDRPVPLDPTVRVRAEAALGNLPGRWVPARRCWLASLRNPDSVVTGCLAIVKGYAVPGATGSEVHLLLEAKGDTDCHACSGLAAFATVSSLGERWQAVARPVIEQNGAYGRPNDPKAIAFAQLGNKRWGWIENSDGFGQGRLEGQVIVRVMRDGLPAVVGTLPGDQDNAGACDEFGVTHPGCERKIGYTVTATPDLSAPDATAYPLVLRAKGVLGRPIDRQVRVPFDEQQGRYMVSPNWPG